MSAVAKYWGQGLAELGGEGNETVLRMVGWTAEGGEMDRETKGRTRHNWTGLRTAKRGRDSNIGTLSYYWNQTQRHPKTEAVG
jgi:hypothetical protein